MKNCRSIKAVLLIGTIILLISSTTIPIVIGYNINNSEKTTIDDNYDCYNISEIPDCIHHLEESNSYDELEKISKSEDKMHQVNSPPTDSAWPMKCHDTYHTGRSPYGTANNSYYELWNYKFDYDADTDPAIGIDGTIYVGGSYKDMVYCFVAINPNGSLKWRYKTGGLVWHMCPSIAEDGTIYFCAWDGYLHAVNPDGSRKWRFKTDDDIVSDPVIGKDGTIYFGTMYGTGGGGEIYAVNPNGTEKWCYKTNYHITSDPAIGDDGTIYIGSGDNFLYAMYPNGTLKWRYKTGDWIKGPPSIAEDGTIYISSYDDYLYALYPNGTLRWKTNIVYGSDTNPSIGLDGTIYICSSDILFAINPDGSIKWEFKLPGSVMKSSSAICADGIIYTGVEIGDRKGGEIVAVNPDGTLHWRSRLSNLWVDSSPCVDENGIIYIVSTNDGSSRLHAFGSGGLVESDAHGPYYGLIDTPLYFSGSALYGYKPYNWSWDFGDGNTSDEQNPTHTYDNPGNYSVTLTVTDNSGNFSESSTFAWIQESNEPPNDLSIDGPNNCKKQKRYKFNFTAKDPEGLNILYYISWGDGYNTGWIGPYNSERTINLSHSWWSVGEYNIRFKAKDFYGAESECMLKVTVPRTRTTSSYHWLWDRFPKLERMLNLIQF